jgi:hypothetical protein
MRTRTLHFVLYLPDRRTAIYRRTAEVSHAALTIENIPVEVSDRVVEVAANLAATAMESAGGRIVIEYAEFVKRRFVTLNR